MPCGQHRCSYPCQSPHNHDLCYEKKTFVFPDCKHKGEKKCYPKTSAVRCNTEIEHDFECSHSKKIACYQKLTNILCTSTCGQCKPCGHLCHEMCSSIHNHLCREEGDVILFKYGHNIKKKCFQCEADVVCKQCVVFIYKTCGHSYHRLCFKPEGKCDEMCATKYVPCGHPCKRRCNEPCADSCDMCAEIEHEKVKKKRQDTEQMSLKIARKQAAEELRKIKKGTGRYPVHGIGELKLDGYTSSEYLDVADPVCKYIHPGHKWIPIIGKIEKVTNIKLQEQWLEAQCEKFDPRRHKLKFHGTSDEGIIRIIKDGFTLPDKSAKNMFGPGMYFTTDSSVSAQELYTKGCNKLCFVMYYWESLTLLRSPNQTWTTF